MTNSKLKENQSQPYLNWTREQLAVTKTKVHKWKVWDSDDGDYEAFIESRRVVIPLPIDDWSFLVTLHEIGHISTGERLYSYLMEYNAEKWAIRRAKDSYGVVCPDYEEDARNYVRKHLIENLVFSELSIEKVKPYVLEWLKETRSSIAKQIVKMDKQGLLDDFKIDKKYWQSVAKS
jgi:hypothetical protein